MDAFRKPALLAIAFLGLEAAPALHAHEVPERPGGALPLAECLDPDRARSWAMLDSDELLVDAGRFRYHLQLAMACPDLGTTATMVLRPGGGIGRICGGPSDAVVPQTQLRITRPCPISEVTPISEAEYRRLIDDGNLAVSDGIGEDTGADGQ